jgi:ubiquinone/menaquinone biosynthesis C-methylase UbiE
MSAATTRSTGARPANPEVYDTVAPDYATYRRWWLALAGGRAERRLRHALRSALHPGIRVLDAGAGTGAVTRAVLDREPTARVTMLDRSAGMLAEAEGLGPGRVQGDVEALPFPPGSFDLVTAAWVLETLPDPERAVREMLRILGPDGRLLTVFSARPRRRLLARLWQPLERIIAAGFAGRFVRTGEVPFHQCRASQRRFPRFAPTSTVFLGRCCLEALTVERRR